MLRSGTCLKWQSEPIRSYIRNLGQSIQVRVRGSTSHSTVHYRKNIEIFLRQTRVAGIFYWAQSYCLAYILLRYQYVNNKVWTPLSTSLHKAVVKVSGLPQWTVSANPKRPQGTHAVRPALQLSIRRPIDLRCLILVLELIYCQSAPRHRVSPQIETSYTGAIRSEAAIRHCRRGTCLFL